MKPTVSLQRKQYFVCGCRILGSFIDLLNGMDHLFRPSGHLLNHCRDLLHLVRHLVHSLLDLLGRRSCYLSDASIAVAVTTCALAAIC